MWCGVGYCVVTLCYVVVWLQSVLFGGVVWKGCGGAWCVWCVLRCGGVMCCWGDVVCACVCDGDRKHEEKFI